MRGLRNVSRASIAAIVVLGGLVVAATPAAASVGVTFTAAGLPSGIALSGTVTTSNGGCNNPGPKSWNLTTPAVSNSNSTGNGAGCPSVPYTVTQTSITNDGNVYTYQSGSPASPASATGASPIAITLTYALTCQKVAITGNPASLTKTVGESATFSVTATGTGLQYQWRKGTTPVGTNSPSYTIPSVTVADVAGNYNVVVTQSCSGASPNNATSTNASLAVNKATPTITWSNPAPITYGTALSATQLNATASVPGSFVYTPASGTVLNAGANNLHVAFTPTDTANYNSATADVNQTVNTKTISVTANNAARPYGAANPSFSASVTGLVNGDTLSTQPTCSTTATSSSPAGTYPITCSGAAVSGSNYTFSYTAGTLTVTQVALIVTADGATRAYGAANPAFTHAITGFVNGDDEGDLTTAPACTTPAVATSAVGTYPISCSGAASANYTFAYSDGSLAVTPVELTVTADDASRAYGDVNPVFTATITGFANSEDEAALTTQPTCTSAADETTAVGEAVISCSGAVATNYTFTYADGTLTIDPAVVTVTADDASRAYGAANPALTATVTGLVNGDELSAEPVCTTAADETSGVGDYPISCSGAAADANYTVAYANGTLTVDPALLTVTADDASRAYDAANPAFSSSVTGFVNDEDDSVLTAAPVCTTAADEASGVGDYPITCSGAAADNYTFSYTDGTLTVTPASLTVTADDASRAYGAANPALTATITGFVNDDDEGDLSATPVCTTTADETSVVGDYPISCSGAAADNYTFTYVDGSLAVTPASLTVTADDASRAYGAANPALTSTITGFVNDEDESVLTAAPVCTTAADETSAAGDYPISCSGAAADNYTFTYVDGTLTVGTITLTVTADNASRAYGAANPAFTATVTGFVDGDDEGDLSAAPVCTTAADETSAVGEYAISCSGAAADNYTFTYADGTLDITPVLLTVTADDASRAYGGPNPALTSTITGFVNDDDEGDLSAAPVCTTAADETSAVGEYAISCSGATADNYTFTYVDGTLDVTAANLTVTADNVSRAYGTANPALTATVTGFVNDDDEGDLSAAPVCTTAADETSPLGEYAISCSGAAADNYTFTYVDGTLTVGTVTLTVTADDASRAYGAANPALTATITGFANGDDESVLTATPVCTTAADENSPVGEYPITCSGAAADNYTFTYVDGSLAVTPASLTVTADDASRAYGAANPALTSTITGFVNDEDESVLTAAPVCTTAADETSAAGDYPISCSGAAADNYSIAYVDGTLTITTVTLTVTVEDAARAYGADNPVFETTVTGFVNGEDDSVLTTAPLCISAASSAPVGTYPISCTGAAADNYTFTYEDGTLTVTPASLTVTADDATRAYGAANPALTATITGFVNDDDESDLSAAPVCATAADETSVVGEYPITCSGAASDNYEFTYSDGTLTVDPAELTVTAQDATRAYGAANPTFTATVTGFVNGEDDGVLTSTPVCSSAADELSPAGSATISCTGVAAPNYSVTYVDGTLTITQVTLTVTVDDATRAYGAANPAFVTTVTGFVNGEDEGVLTAAPSCASAAASAPVGTYPISCTGAAADNYTFDYVDGTLTITTVELTVTANSTSRPAGSPNPTFTATVTGFANGETTAVLTTQPSCTSAANAASPAGPYPITCSGAAATNYTFTYVAGTLTVTPAGPTGPVIRVGDASVAEGSTTGKKNSLTFTVTVDKPVTAITEVLWALSDGTATGGKASPADFQAKTNGKLKLAAGKKAGVINVNVLPDTTVEPNETLTLTLLSANSGAVLGDATASGTILDDDSAGSVQMSIGDAQAWEGNTGTKTAVGKLWVTLNNPAASTITVTVSVAVVNTTATDGKVSPADYKTFKTKTLTFKPGQWKKAVALNVFADTSVEPDDVITIALSGASPGVTLTKATGTLTILNDD